MPHPGQTALTSLASLEKNELRGLYGSRRRTQALNSGMGVSCENVGATSSATHAVAAAALLAAGEAVNNDAGATATLTCDRAAMAPRLHFT